MRNYPRRYLKKGQGCKSSVFVLWLRRTLVIFHSKFYLLIYLLFYLCIYLSTDCVGAFNSTNKLLESLNNLQAQVSASIQCYRDLTGPFIAVARFVSNISEISQNLTELYQRSVAVQDTSHAILMIPGVNSIGAPALMQLTSGLKLLSQSVRYDYLHFTCLSYVQLCGFK